ncbi:MAG: hypothetical protein QOG15_759 [Solirubrobacteraceae bacterium]|nr:hypothetical protein [Solirubrobacteraceae bacterium]
MRSVGLLVLVLAVAIAAAAPASAASLTTLSRCYQEQGDVVATGAGYAASSVVTLTRDGTNIGSVATDAQGAFKGKFATPKLPTGVYERVYDLVATDGTNSALGRYRATKLVADFSPGSGNLKTLRVRFRIRGFNLLKAGSTVFMHYVRPNGSLRKTVRLGVARGACGHIRRTKQRRLFPFAATRGRWALQFDTRKTYTRATATSNFVWVRRPVEVFGQG